MRKWFHSRGYRRFSRNRLAVFSLRFMVVAVSLSFFAPLLCNDHPLIVHYEGKYFFPVFAFYPAERFGEDFVGEANYKHLEKMEKFQGRGNWMLFPPVRHGVNEVTENLPTPPPSPPTAVNWLGTDDRGRDLFTRLVYGFRNSMLFALLSWGSISLLGYFIGGVQGYLGGRWDLLGQRLMEVWSALPLLYVIIFLLSIFVPSLFLLSAVWVAFGWLSLAGYVRAEVLRVRKMDFVVSARALGCGQRRILFRHILPNVLTPFLTFAPFILSASIGSLAALDYLGLGLPPPAASWGELLRQGKENLRSWWLAFFPVFCLFSTLLFLSFIGEGVREAFDTRE